MMGKRVEYIDKLKGFAIILVVMGHVLEKGMGVTETCVNVFYSSFHMPLFMFLSGLFAMKSFRDWSKDECLCFLKNKVTRIILPFFTVGGMWSLLMYGNIINVYIGEGSSSFWFLPALFYCMLTAMFVGIINNLLPFKENIFLYLSVHLCLWAILYAIYLGFHSLVPYYLSFLKQYPFFVFGVLCSKYNYLNRIQNSANLMSMSLVLFLLSIWLQLMFPIPISLSGFFAIIVLINLFSYFDSRIPKQLVTIGVASLQIYVFHWFLIPDVCLINIGGGNSEILNNMNFVPYMMIALVLTIPIIFLCMILKEVINRSYWLNIFLFGGK